MPDRDITKMDASDALYPIVSKPDVLGDGVVEEYGTGARSCGNYFLWQGGYDGFYGGVARRTPMDDLVALSRLVPPMQRGSMHDLFQNFNLRVDSHEELKVYLPLVIELQALRELVVVHTSFANTKLVVDDDLAQEEAELHEDTGTTLHAEAEIAKLRRAQLRLRACLLVFLVRLQGWSRILDAIYERGGREQLIFHGGFKQIGSTLRNVLTRARDNALNEGARCFPASEDRGAEDEELVRVLEACFGKEELGCKVRRIALRGCSDMCWLRRVLLRQFGTMGFVYEKEVKLFDTTCDCFQKAAALERVTERNNSVHQLRRVRQVLLPSLDHRVETLGSTVAAYSVAPLLLL